jgi:hypothetical protein
MMKTLLLALALLGSVASFAQNATYKYHLNGNLNEMYAKGPALTSPCPGTYAAETLLGTLSKMTYRFNKGCGLIYNDATKSFITPGTYTIEMYFKLDTTSGYTKLIDFDSLKQDAGLYNQSGKIVLYPNFTSLDSFVGPNSWTYVAISRDGPTNKMYVNANGKSAGNYTDNTNLYRLGLDKLLTFFMDDKGTGGEQSKGAVAMIQISNYVVDSNTIKTNYVKLKNTLDVEGIGAQNGVFVYPNPATRSVHVAVAAGGSYSVCDVAGRTVKKGELVRGENEIVVEGLNSGVYLLNLAGEDGVGGRVYRFCKE